MRSMWKNVKIYRIDRRWKRDRKYTGIDTNGKEDGRETEKEN